MTNRTEKRAKRSRAKTLVAATGLALAVISASPAAGFGPALDGRAEAQYHVKMKLVYGPFQLCVWSCYLGRCCAYDKPTFPYWESEFDAMTR